MTTAVDEAIQTRWQDGNLHTSIAKLYPGSVDAAPEGTVLPRAVYELPDEEVEYRSRDSRVVLQQVIFSVIGIGHRTVSGYVDSIESVIVSSQVAGSNPRAISGGTVMDVRFTSRSVSNLEKNIFDGRLVIVIQWRRGNAAP